MHEEPDSRGSGRCGDKGADYHAVIPGHLFISRLRPKSEQILNELNIWDNIIFDFVREMDDCCNWSDC